MTIFQTLEHFNKEELLRVASSLRPEWGPCNFVLQQQSPSTLPAEDMLWLINPGNSILLLLQFEYSPDRWTVKLPVNTGIPEEVWSRCLVSPLQFIARTLPRIPAPRVHASCLSYDNPIRVPYILLDWIEGKSLPEFTDSWPGQVERTKILDQVSDILLDLIYQPLDDAKDIRYYGINSNSS
jgi:hypothetical protein